MAEVNVVPVYTCRFTEKEFTLITKALAACAGVPQVRPRPDDLAEMGDLNQRLLQLSASNLRDRLATAENKVVLATGVDSAPSESAAAPATPALRRIAT